MKTCRLFCSLLLVAACLSMASCDSKNPISSPENAKADPELAGVWMKKESGNVQYYHIALAGGKLPAGVQRAILVVHQENGDLKKPEEFYQFTSEIGENKYLNIPFITKEGLEQIEQTGLNPHTYILAKYQIKGDKLTLWPLDPEAKRRAVQSGKIKGDLIDKSNAHFTDTSENIAKFLASPDSADLFAKEPLVYERVK
jgi:hypothetical protein